MCTTRQEGALPNLEQVTLLTCSGRDGGAHSKHSSLKTSCESLQEGQELEVILESVSSHERGLRLSGKGFQQDKSRESRNLTQTIEDVISDQSSAKVYSRRFARFPICMHSASL